MPITEAGFADGMTAVRRAAESLGCEPTFFELVTAVALWHFAREGVDWVVWETGLGGRLDATSIVTPAVCIITNIGLDHQQYLGASLAEIAAEKAGIIKPGVPLVSAVEPGEAEDVIRARAAELGAPLTLVRRELRVEDLGLRDDQQVGLIDHHQFSINLIGAHQVFNAACAVAALRRLGLQEDAIATGLENTVWPGRFEILSAHPLVVLDGAHNIAGTRMLVETWRAFLAERFEWRPGQIDARARLVFASVTDKDITEMARLLRPLAREVLLVRLANERGADPAALAPAFDGLRVTCYDSVAEAWQVVQQAAPSSVTLITGSLFLVGEMLAHRQGIGEEYRLNERLEKVTASRQPVI
ncbi:MAG: Mur ligase family protein [Verrucomicrobiota bacterium]